MAGIEIKRPNSGRWDVGMYLLQDQLKSLSVGFLRQRLPSGSWRTVQKSGVLDDAR